MKTLEQIKEEYFKELGFKDLDHAIMEIAIGKSKIASATILENHFSEIAKLYATECAKEALRLASENAKIWCESSISGLELNSYTKFLVDDNNIAFDSETVNVYKQSIISENNLPKHR